MYFKTPFTESDILRADKAPVTPNMLANAAFESIRAICTFQSVSLMPLLRGLLNQTPREQVVVIFYYRIAAYLISLYKLNGPIHFQAIAASARSIFELGIDMALFSKDPTDKSLNRLNAFTCVERYRVAKKLVDFYATKPLPSGLDLSKQRSLCADPKEKLQVEGLVDKYWGVTIKVSSCGPLIGVLFGMRGVALVMSEAFGRNGMFNAIVTALINAA